MSEPTSIESPMSLEVLDLEIMWLSLVQRPWTSLVVVPTEPGLSPYLATAALAESGSLHELGMFETITSVGAGGHDGLRLARNLASRVAAGKRVVALVAPFSESMAGLPLAAAAQRALLLIRYGSSMAAARSTIDLIGREKLLGAVALRAE